MNTKKSTDIALFRYGIIAPLVTGTIDDNLSKSAFFNQAASRVYEHPNGEDYKISAYTIARWYRAYMKNGFDGLKPQSRSDKATYRKVDEDIMTQISYLIKEYPRLPATLVYQKLKDNGTIRSKEISLSTVLWPWASCLGTSCPEYTAGSLPSGPACRLPGIWIPALHSAPSSPRIRNSWFR